MTSLFDEEPILLHRAAASIPGRTGKGVHLATLYRWAVHGVRGVRLETRMIGGQRATSREALDRFFKAIDSATPASLPTPTSRQRRAAIARAEKILDAAGV